MVGLLAALSGGLGPPGKVIGRGGRGKEEREEDRIGEGGQERKRRERTGRGWERG